MANVEVDLGYLAVHDKFKYNVASIQRMWARLALIYL